jgi:antitoxin PrlF
MNVMKLAHSRITAQGQITIPAEVRRRLGLAPGSTIEWDAEGDHVVVRRVGSVDSAAIHAALFDEQPRARTLDELKDGLRRRARSRAGD